MFSILVQRVAVTKCAISTRLLVQLYLGISLLPCSPSSQVSEFASHPGIVQECRPSNSSIISYSWKAWSLQNRVRFLSNCSAKLLLRNVNNRRRKKQTFDNIITRPSVGGCYSVMYRSVSQWHKKSVPNTHQFRILAAIIDANIHYRANDDRR